MGEVDNNVALKEMVGMTFTSVVLDEERGAINFYVDGDNFYTLTHKQECCENVYIESIVGDLSDLLLNPILEASEVTNKDLPVPKEILEDKYWDDNPYTWTFYKFATIRGHVDIRFFGTSNGFYSEGVSVYKKVNGQLYLWEYTYTDDYKDMISKWTKRNDI